MKAILSVDEGKAYLQNADTNAYLEARFENIDVSGPINTHNASPDAHNDIREAVSNAATVASNAASAAAEAQRTADGKAAASHTHTKSQITDFPSSMPASDVYSWAKAATKPTYTASEVGAAASSHNHDASAITSGTLPVARGGTGATSINALATSLGASRISVGSYKGTGQGYTNDRYKKTLTFSFQPQIVIVWRKQAINWSSYINIVQPITAYVSDTREYTNSSGWSESFGILVPVLNDTNGQSGYIGGAFGVDLYTTFSSTSVTWWASYSSQMYNDSNANYGYIAFG